MMGRRLISKARAPAHLHLKLRVFIVRGSQDGHTPPQFLLVAFNGGKRNLKVRFHLIAIPHELILAARAIRPPRGTPPPQPPKRVSSFGVLLSLFFHFLPHFQILLTVPLSLHELSHLCKFEMLFTTHIYDHCIKKSSNPHRVVILFKEPPERCENSPSIHIKEFFHSPLHAYPSMGVVELTQQLNVDQKII